MENEQLVNIDMLKKYDKAGPRYTSYPLATSFSKVFTEWDFRNCIVQNNNDKQVKDLSLYIHIPFCDTLCFFCGCNMMVTRNRKKIRKYVDYLKREILLTKKLLSPQRKVTQVHWGGGTPNSLNPDEILELGEFINVHFQFVKDAEFGAEIDPRELTKQHLECLRNVGFNRISLGIQVQKN